MQTLQPTNLWPCVKSPLLSFNCLFITWVSAPTRSIMLRESYELLDVKITLEPLEY